MSKYQTFAKVSFVSAGNIGNAALGFLFLTAVAKALSLDDFGKYALLTGILTLIARIMDFGTNSLFVAHAESDSKYTQTFLGSKLILFLIALPISLISLFFLNLSTQSLVTIFVLGLAAYGFNFTIYAIYQKTQQYFEVVLINTIPSLIKAGYALAVLFGYINLDLVGAFAVFTYSIFGGILVCAFLPYDEAISLTKWKVSLNDILDFIKKSVSPGVSQLIFESWQTVNNVLTKIYNTFTDVGIFSMANKISSIFALLSFSIFTVLLPKNAQRKREDSLAKSYDFYETGVLAVAVLILSLMAIVLSEIFLTRMFGEKFSDSIKFLDILIFASAITSVQNFAESYFYVEKQTQYLVRINATKLVLLTFVAAVCIPIFGLVSLAYANLISALAGIILTYTFIQKLERARLP